MPVGHASIAGHTSIAGRSGGWVAAALPIGAVAAIDPGGYQPFGPARYLAISTMVLLALAGLLAGRRWLAVSQPARWWWAALLGWMLVATLAGVDRFHAWVGLPERRLGLVAWLLFAAAWVVGGSLDAGERHRVALGCVAALAIIDVYALAEAFGAAPVDTGAASIRLGGPFGSAAFLGAACCLLIPLAAGVGFDPATTPRWRWAGRVVALGGVAAVAGSGTRAAWVGLLAAAVTSLAACRRRFDRRMAVVAAVAATGAFVVGGWLLPETERPHDAIGRDAGSARLDEWEVAMRALVDRPILGAGPEGYRIVAGASIDAAYERAHGRRVLTDRAHNGLLDVAVAGGVPALLLYAGLLAAVGRLAWRAARRGATPWMAGSAIGLIAYVAQQMFLFPVAEFDPVAWLLAGVVTTGTTAITATTAAAPTTATRRPASATVRLPTVVAVIPLGLAVGGGWFGVREVIADRHTRHVIGALNAGQPAVAVAEAIDAVRLRPDVLRNRIGLARALAAAGSPAAAEAAVQVLDEALDWSPRDPLVAAERAGYLTTIAASDPRRAPAAVAAWEALAADDPHNTNVQMQLGLARVFNQDETGAEAAWRSAADLAPASAAPLIQLTRLYASTGRPDDARASLAEARQRAPGDPRVAEAAALIEAAGLDETPTQPSTG